MVLITNPHNLFGLKMWVEERRMAKGTEGGKRGRRRREGEREAATSSPFARLSASRAPSYLEQATRTPGGRPEGGNGAPC